MVKFFYLKYAKLHGQSDLVKKFGTHRKVLLQEMHMSNMKALSIVVHDL